MKKLLLLLLFTISANAQITQPTPYLLCDVGIPGFEVFDLTSKVPEILNGMNPSENSVVFYNSELDAQNDTNAIVNPSAYMNSVSPTMTLGVKVTNNLGEHSYTTLVIGIIAAPTANPAFLTFCEDFALVIYNPNSTIPQITNGSVASSVTFHETLNDAEIGANPIDGNFYIPIINPGAQILYARVVNPATGCFAITTLTLNTNNCGAACPAPTLLTASNVTDTTLTLNWVNSPNSNGSIFQRICIVPYGEAPSTTNSIISQAPSTSFMITGLLPNACYSVYIQNTCSTSESSNWSEPLNICLNDCANSGTCSEILVLNAFLDSNTNGIKDTGEASFNYGNFVYQINDSGTDLYGNSNSGSYYIFDSNPTNSYDISFIPNPDFASYFSSTTTFSNVTLPNGGGSNYLYFPVISTQPFIDGQVSLYNQNIPRPGFPYVVTISLSNHGFENIANGTVTFTKASNVTISSVSEAGIVSTPTGFTYDFSNLGPNQYRTINVTLLVPTIPTVNLGDLVTNSVSIQVANDVNASNNNSSFTQTIVGSYDPNDKAESHGGKIVFEDFTANDYLYYTIRFENTGTASAEFIRVEDALSTDLDENTFEMLEASHPVNTRREGNQLTWHFFDVNLPPSSINSNDGHGFVYFRIKPKAGYAIGDIIPNAASIFFDYNPPIVTDPFLTEFVESLGNPSFANTSFTVYPNPASHFITIIQNNNNPIKDVVFYDVSGKAVKKMSALGNSQVTIDTSVLAKGMYFLEITDGNHLKQVKKILIE